jgi:hypothetical protein
LQNRNRFAIVELYGFVSINNFITFAEIHKSMNSTTTSIASLNALNAQFIEDTAGVRLVVLPQKVVEVLLKSKGRNVHSIQKRLLLAEKMEKESNAVRESSMEVLPEFEAIDL